LATAYVLVVARQVGAHRKGLAALLDELATQKINFISLKDRIDLGTAAGRLIANVLASVASFTSGRTDGGRRVRRRPDTHRGSRSARGR
jgi:DNA invertase Pin-like site-specific DNA recombinase